MKKIDFKGSLLTVCYYAVLFFGAFIIYKLREKTAITFSTKYSSLIILVICLLFILFGILVFYFADRKNVSRQTRLLESVTVIIPSLLLMFSGFGFAKLSYMKILPIFIQSKTEILFAAVGSILLTVQFITIITNRR